MRRARETPSRLAISAGTTDLHVAQITSMISPPIAHTDGVRAGSDRVYAPMVATAKAIAHTVAATVPRAIE